MLRTRNRARGGSRGSPAFSPSDLGADLLAWYDFGDDATITATGTNITSVADKSVNARTLTGVSSPQWVSNEYVDTTGSRYFRRDETFMFDAGGVYVFAVMRSDGTANGTLITEASSTDPDVTYQLGKAQQVNSNDLDFAFVKNNENDTLVASTSTLSSTVFDNTKKIYTVLDSGTQITSYVNGVAGATPQTYSRTGTYSFNRFCLGGVLTTTFSRPLAANIWDVIITKNTILNDTVNKILKYLSDKHGIPVLFFFE